MVVYLLKTVFLQQVLIGGRAIAAQLCFSLALQSCTDSFVPSATTICHLGKFIYVHVPLVLLIAQGNDVSDVIHSGDTELSISCFEKTLLCVPDDEILLRQLVEDEAALAVRIRIILASVCAQRNLAHHDLKSCGHGVTTGDHHFLDSCTIVLRDVVLVGVRKKADGGGIALELVELLTRPIGAQ